MKGEPVFYFIVKCVFGTKGLAEQVPINLFHEKANKILATISNATNKHLNKGIQTLCLGLNDKT